MRVPAGRRGRRGGRDGFLGTVAPAPAWAAGAKYALYTRPAPVRGDLRDACCLPWPLSGFHSAPRALTAKPRRTVLPRAPPEEVAGEGSRGRRGLPRRGGRAGHKRLRPTLEKSIRLLTPTPGLATGENHPRAEPRSSSPLTNIPPSGPWRWLMKRTRWRERGGTLGHRKTSHVFPRTL